MAIIRLKVTYADLREEYVIASPRARVMAEEFVGSNHDTKMVAGHFYLAWAALNKAGREPLDFETWLDKIIDVDEAEEPEPRPTPPAPSADTSSD